MQYAPYRIGMTSQPLCRTRPTPTSLPNASERVFVTTQRLQHCPGTSTNVLPPAPLSAPAPQAKLRALTPLLAVRRHSCTSEHHGFKLKIQQAFGILPGDHVWFPTTGICYVPQHANLGKRRQHPRTRILSFKAQSHVGTGHIRILHTAQSRGLWNLHFQATCIYWQNMHD
jgi:hypothetical protein